MTCNANKCAVTFDIASALAETLTMAGHPNVARRQAVRHINRENIPQSHARPKIGLLPAGLEDTRHALQVTLEANVHLQSRRQAQGIDNSAVDPFSHRSSTPRFVPLRNVQLARAMAALAADALWHAGKTVPRIGNTLCNRTVAIHAARIDRSREAKVRILKAGTHGPAFLL